MKKILLFLASLLFGFLLFIWIGKIVGWQEIKNAFSVFTGWHGLAIFFLSLLIVMAGIWKWKEILKGAGVEISFRNLSGPYLAGSSLMYLVPILVWGGEMFRGYVLKEKNSVPWPKAMASVIIDRILEWTAFFAVIFVGILIFLLTIGLPPLKLGIIFGGTFLILLSAISLFYFKCIKKESIAQIFIKKESNQLLEVEKEIFRFFKIKKIAMWKGFGISFLRVAMMYFRAWFLILFLGKSITALLVFPILGFTYLAAIIPIPTALGSHEAIQTIGFSALGLGASTATAFTMIIRAVELVLSFAGVIVLFRLGIQLLEKSVFKKAEKLTEIING